MNPFIGASLISAGSGLLNNILQFSSMDKQVSAQKDLMKYQWDNFASPSAQARAYAAAGFNPATALGNGNLTSALPSAPSVTSPQFSVGIENLSQLGSFMKSVADAKKAGVDTNLSEQEIKNKQVQQKRDEFELDLRKLFGKSESVLSLANAYQQVLLANDSHDLNLKEKALKDWQTAKEKALSELSEHERDIAAKRLANTDTEIKLQNEESKARAKASNAAANASNASADKMRSEKYYQDIVNSLKDGIYTEEFESMLSQARANKQISEAQEQKAKNMYNRYNHLNENDKQEAAEYLNYMLWWLKNETPSLPIVPLLNLGK